MLVRLLCFAAYILALSMAVITGCRSIDFRARTVSLIARSYSENDSVTPEVKGQIDQYRATSNAMQSLTRRLLVAGVGLWLVSLYMLRNGVHHSGIVKFLMHELPIVFAVIFTLMALVIV